MTPGRLEARTYKESATEAQERTGHCLNGTVLPAGCRGACNLPPERGDNGLLGTVGFFGGRPTDPSFNPHP